MIYFTSKILVYHKNSSFYVTVIFSMLQPSVGLVLMLEVANAGVQAKKICVVSFFFCIGLLNVPHIKIIIVFGLYRSISTCPQVELTFLAIVEHFRYMPIIT